MTGSGSFWRRWRMHVLRGLAAPALVALAAGPEPRAPTDRAVELPPPRPSASAGALQAPVYTDVLPPLDLAACRRLALERQPAIAAAQASLAAANARLHSLEDLRVPSFLARDLPVRKQQAAVGIAVAEAGVQVAQNNTVFAATYCYLAALYASEQQKVAEDALTRLTELHSTVALYQPKSEEDKGRTKFGPRDLALIDTHIHSTRARLVETQQGRQRALSGLREALALGPSCQLEVIGRGLFEVSPVLSREALLQLACTRRPEVVQALHGVEVTNLEALAQARRSLPSAPTFASGSDIHAQPLPAGSYGTSYSPAAVGPEMPGTFNGPRCDRVEMANIYAGRAGSVLEKTRNLILLETEQAYLLYVEASKKAGEYREAVRRSNVVASEARKKLEEDIRNPELLNISLQPILASGQLVAQQRVNLNEARYQALLALAILERATAGGFDAAFECAPALPAAPGAEVDGEKGKKDGNGNSEIPSGGKEGDKDKEKGGKDTRS